VRRWRRLPKGVDVNEALRRTYRADVFRAAAVSLGLRVPDTDTKAEGTHAKPWRLGPGEDGIEMGADCFFDGQRFAGSNQPASKLSASA